MPKTQKVLTQEDIVIPTVTTQISIAVDFKNGTKLSVKRHMMGTITFSVSVSLTRPREEEQKETWKTGAYEAYQLLMAWVADRNIDPFIIERLYQNMVHLGEHSLLENRSPYGSSHSMGLPFLDTLDDEIFHS